MRIADSAPMPRVAGRLPATFTEEIMGFVIGILVAVILVIVILELI